MRLLCLSGVYIVVVWCVNHMSIQVLSKWSPVIIHTVSRCLCTIQVEWIATHCRRMMGGVVDIVLLALLNLSNLFGWWPSCWNSHLWFQKRLKLTCFILQVFCSHVLSPSTRENAQVLLVEGCTYSSCIHATNFSDYEVTHYQSPGPSCVLSCHCLLDI